MVFKINNVSILPYLAHQGLRWQRSDLDTDNAFRTQDGEMHRARVATKIRWDITCRPLKASEAQIVLNLILPEFVTVECEDPMYGLITKQFYSNNNVATHMLVQEDGTEWWDGIEFPLVEK